MKERVLDIGPDKIYKVLNVLKSKKKYTKEIERTLDWSVFVGRPIISALYASGFIEKEEFAKANFYSLSKTGERLLHELEEDLKK